MTDGHSRRRFLAATATLGAAALAGCGADVDDSDGQQSRELVLTLTHVDGPLHETRVLDLAERDPDWDVAAFEAARDGETYTTQYRKPFFSDPEDPVYVLDDGTYYRLGSVVVDEVATTHPVLRLYDDDETTATPVDEPVAAPDLPSADERAVQIAQMAARARGNVGGMPVGLVQRGGYVYRDEEAADESRLLGADGPSHVTFQERVYRVEVTEERFHEPVYRATAEPVADSPETMEAALRGKFLDARFSRDDVSREARDALVEARGEGYAESHPYSSAYEELLPEVDLLFAPARDARAVLGISGDAAEIAATLQDEYEIETVVVTRGESGALARRGDETVEQSAYDAATVDPVGSGDAFAGGFLSRYVRGDSLSRALEYGAATAALKRTIRGDLALVTEAEVEAVIEAGSADIDR